MIFAVVNVMQEMRLIAPKIASCVHHSHRMHINMMRTNLNNERELLEEMYSINKMLSRAPNALTRVGAFLARYLTVTRLTYLHLLIYDL